MQHANELNAYNLLLGRDAHHEIAILMINDARIEAADSHECFPSEQYDSKVRVPKVKLFWREARCEWRRWEHPRQRLQVFVRAARDAVGKCGTRVGLERSELWLHVSWQPCVVVIEEGDEGSLCQRQARIASAADVVVVDAQVGNSALPRDPLGLVYRVIVDNNNLFRRRDEGRVEDAPDRQVEHHRLVVRGDYDGYISLRCGIA
jgi:hypothetical protein